MLGRRGWLGLSVDRFDVLDFRTSHWIDEVIGSFERGAFVGQPSRGDILGVIIELAGNVAFFCCSYGRAGGSPGIGSRRRVAYGTDGRKRFFLFV